MRTLAAALIISAASTPAAHAQSLETMAAQIIRNAGYWCAKATDVIPDQWASTPNRRVVTVACDDGREYARYQITMNRQGTAAECWGQVAEAVGLIGPHKAKRDAAGTAGTAA